MKIIHVTSPSQIGGTITSTLRQAGAQRRAGREAVVWSAVQRQGEQVAGLAQRWGVPCRQQSRGMLAARLVSLRLHPGRGVIHLHSGHGAATALACWLNRLIPPGYPMVVTLHGTSDVEDWTDEKRRAAHRGNLREIAAVGVPSAFERERQIDLGVAEDRVFVLPDPVVVPRAVPGELRARLGIRGNDRVVVFCGRLTPQKGVRTLIAACDALLPARSDTHVVIAGDGVLRREIEMLAQRYPERCHVLGHLDDVGPVYADADVYVSPSTGESFGISAMEAGLAALPMVLSRIRPWTDVFSDGRECVFFTPRDTEAFTQAIADILEDPWKAKTFGVCAKLKVQNTFSENAVVEALDRMYARVADRVS